MIRPFGDSALLIEFDGPGGRDGPGGQGPGERGEAAAAAWAASVAAALAADPVPGVAELVPGLRSVLVELDRAAAPERLMAEIEARVAAAPSSAPAGRERIIPVVYGGEHGPDLDEVARLCGLAAAEVIELHARGSLRVLFGGFAPGFAYLGHLPPQLRIDRLATPRTRTPAGSVAIAGGLTGIYPAELPGGWRVIGRTPVALFDPRRDPPAYLVAGDEVRFEPMRASDWPERPLEADDWG